MPYKKNLKVSDLGEDYFIEKVTKGLIAYKDVVIGAGDDCAVIKTSDKKKFQLLKTDSVVEGVHYLSSDSPIAVGYKAMARAMSDIAAMGGTPHHALVTLIINPSSKLSYIKSLYKGLSKAAALYEISIVGGETATAGKNSKNSITISLTGSVQKNQCCYRSKGKPGHKLYVTGKMGGSIKGKHLKFTPRIKEARWLASKFTPSAMMDLSDGLASDLPKLARASHCGYEIDVESIPRSRGSSIKEALNDGEDYELLFAISPKKVAALESNWNNLFSDLNLTCIGKLQALGIRKPKLDGGWQHF